MHRMHWLHLQYLPLVARWFAGANFCPGVAKVKAWQLCKPSSKCGNPELDIDEFWLFLPIFDLVFRCVSISMCFGQAKCPREFVDAVTVGFENRLASNKAVPVAAHARVGALTLHARTCSLMVLPRCLCLVKTWLTDTTIYYNIYIYYRYTYAYIRIYVYIHIQENSWTNVIRWNRTAIRGQSSSAKAPKTSNVSCFQVIHIITHLSST